MIEDGEELDDLFSKTERFLESRFKLRLNNVANRLEIMDLDNPEIWTEINENDLMIMLHKKRIRIGMASLLTLLKSSFVPQENPIEQYFNSLPKWKGKDHIKELAGYFICKDITFEHHFKKHLVRTVQCALDPHKYNKQCLVLLGKQNDGKSHFIRWLCPPELREYYTEDITFDKDGLKALATNFMINIDELSVLQRVEVDHLKKFFSVHQSKLRPAFERKEMFFTRRASFFASTNREEFLTDETGSVRWVVFKMESINWAYSSKIKQKDIWSQAFALYKAKDYKPELTVQEIAENEDRNKSYTLRSPEMDLLMENYRPAEEGQPWALFLTATQIQEQLTRRSGNMIKLYPRSVGKALISLGFERVSRRIENMPVYGYWVSDIGQQPGTGQSIP